MTITPLMLIMIFWCRYFLKLAVGALLTAFIVMLSVIGMIGGFELIQNLFLMLRHLTLFLMLSALTIAHCVHIMSTQKIQMRLGKNRKDAVDESLRGKFYSPVFL